MPFPKIAGEGARATLADQIQFKSTATDKSVRLTAAQSLQSLQVSLGLIEVGLEIDCLLQLLFGLVFVTFFFEHQAETPMACGETGFIALGRLAEISPQIFFCAGQVLILRVQQDGLGGLIVGREIVGNFALGIGEGGVEFFPASLLGVDSGQGGVSGDAAGIETNGFAGLFFGVRERGASLRDVEVGRLSACVVELGIGVDGLLHQSFKFAGCSFFVGGDFEFQKISADGIGADHAVGDFDGFLLVEPPAMPGASR